MAKSKTKRAKLNKLLRELVELRDGKRCLRCGKTDTLHLSHIYPKGKYRKLEFEPDNVKFLCVADHLFWWHRNPVEASEWIHEVKPEQMEKLDRRKMLINSGPIDYEALELIIKNEIERLK